MELKKGDYVWYEAIRRKNYRRPAIIVGTGDSEWGKLLPINYRASVGGVYDIAFIDKLGPAGSVTTHLAGADRLSKMSPLEVLAFIADEEDDSAI